MTRKIYYLILAISFCLTAVFHLLDILVFNSMGISNNYVYTAKVLLILFILFCETENATKSFRLINRIAIPIMFIGLMFKVMHWPFSLVLFLAPAITIMIVLFINNFKNTTERGPVFLILTIPLIHLLFMCIKIFHLPGAGLVWLLESIMILVLVIVLFLRINRMEN